MFSCSGTVMASGLVTLLKSHFRQEREKLHGRKAQVPIGGKRSTAAVHQSFSSDFAFKQVLFGDQADIR